MKRIIFCYIGLLLGIIMGWIFLYISGIIKHPTYSSPVAQAIPKYVVWFAFLLQTGIPFTIFWTMLFIFNKTTGWQMPVSKIQNMEIGFFFAFLYIAGDVSVFGRFHSWVHTSWWKALYSHLYPFAHIFFNVLDIVFWFIYSFIIFLLVVIMDYWILVKVPGFSVKR